MIKLAQSTVNEEERKRILYQSLMVIINLISCLNFHDFFLFIFHLVELGVERSGTKV